MPSAIWCFFKFAYDTAKFVQYRFPSCLFEKRNVVRSDRRTQSCEQHSPKLTTCIFVIIMFLNCLYSASWIMLVMDIVINCRGSTDKGHTTERQGGSDWRRWCHGRRVSFVLELSYVISFEFSTISLLLYLVSNILSPIGMFIWFGIR